MTTTLVPAAVPNAGSPSATQRVGRGRGIGFGVFGPIAAAAVCMPLVILAVVAPKFMEIFRDFGVALPSLSGGLIRGGVALGTPLGVGFVLLLGVVVVLVVGMAWRVNRVIGAVLLLLCGAWFLLSLGIGIVGFFLPLLAMIESLQRGGAV